VTHHGDAYGALVLKYFGNELLRAGCHDAAADVFYRLLLEAEDRVQQTEYLQLCLDCWSSGTVSTAAAEASYSAQQPGSSARRSMNDGWSHADAAECVQQHHQQQQQQHKEGGSIAATAAPVNPMIINKLADFVQRQQSLSPRAIVHMLHSTTDGSEMGLQLCQVLLARAAARAAAAAGPGSAGEDALGLPGGLGGVLEVLVAFITLGNRQIHGHMDNIAHQLQALQAAAEQKEQQSKGGCEGGAAGVAQAVTAATFGTSSSAAHDEPGGCSSTTACENSSRTQWRGIGKPGRNWLKGKHLHAALGRVSRGAAAGTLAVASLVGGNHLLWRVARIGPLIFLLHTGL